jgi:hypothetical protein
MHAFMCDAPFRGCAIFRPLLFDVDQRALAWAEEVVLECGERDEIGVVEHPFLSEECLQEQKFFCFFFSKKKCFLLFFFEKRSKKFLIIAVLTSIYETFAGFDCLQE